MKSCDKKRLALLAAGTLSPLERRAVQAHLANCAECQKTHRELAAISNELASHAAALPKVDGMRELHQSLERHLYAAQEQPEIPRVAFWVRTWFFRFAVSMTALVALLMIWSNAHKRGSVSHAPQIVRLAPVAPKSMTVPPAPTFSSYSSASRRSLEEFDRALDAQIRAASSSHAPKEDSSVNLNALL